MTSFWLYLYWHLMTSKQIVHILRSLCYVIFWNGLFDVMFSLCLTKEIGCSVYSKLFFSNYYYYWLLL